MTAAQTGGAAAASIAAAVAATAAVAPRWLLVVLAVSLLGMVAVAIALLGEVRLTMRQDRATTRIKNRAAARELRRGVPDASGAVPQVPRTVWDCTMLPEVGGVARSGRWRDSAVVYLGRQVAAALIDDRPGDAEGRDGWRGALQSAATITRNDAVVLRIADEIYAAAPDLRAPAAVRAYAQSTGVTVLGGPGRSLLDGMPELVDELRETR